jgi:hypothetical protein
MLANGTDVSCWFAVMVPRIGAIRVCCTTTVLLVVVDDGNQSGVLIAVYVCDDVSLLLAAACWYIDTPPIILGRCLMGQV